MQLDEEQQENLVISEVWKNARDTPFKPCPHWNQKRNVNGQEAASWDWPRGVVEQRDSVKGTYTGTTGGGLAHQSCSGMANKVDGTVYFGEGMLCKAPVNRWALVQ